jgi:hypothetical protein
MAPGAEYGEVLGPWDQPFLEIVGTLDEGSREFHPSASPLYLGKYKWSKTECKRCLISIAYEFKGINRLC